MPVRTIHTILILALFGAAPASAAAEADSTGKSSSAFHWFPNAPLFPHLDADGTAQQLSLCKDLDSRSIVGSIGGLQRMIETRIGELPVQVGIGATVYGSFVRMPHVLDVVTADFFVDFPLDIKLSDRLTFRTGWGHHSGHLVDDGIEALNLHSINYAKDYSPFLLAYSIPPLAGFVYGGVRFDYYTIPEVGKHWNLRFGIEGGRIALTDDLMLYGALDLKCRQETGWGTTESYQIGLRTVVFGAREIRFAYTYRTGPDERGQFYLQSHTSSLFGIFLDF